MQRSAERELVERYIARSRGSLNHGGVRSFLAVLTPQATIIALHPRSAQQPRILEAYLVAWT